MPCSKEKIDHCKSLDKICNPNTNKCVKKTRKNVLQYSTEEVLSIFTISELRKMGKELGLTFPERAKKEDIIEVLEKVKAKKAQEKKIEELHGLKEAKKESFRHLLLLLWSKPKVEAILKGFLKYPPKKQDIEQAQQLNEDWPIFNRFSEMQNIKDFPTLTKFKFLENIVYLLIWQSFITSLLGKAKFEEILQHFVFEADLMHHESGDVLNAMYEIV